MNILVPDSWLKEHLKTKATPKQIAEYLSLCSQSVEKLTKKGDDWLYEVEVTINRPDCLSVYGIARELSAILPRFGIKARLKEIPEERSKIPEVKKGLPLEVKIRKPSLCPRFTALIFDNVKLKSSPKKIQDRLEKSGIRALNSVVDISNYLMLELGQPMHTFDYDKVLEAKMILREAAGGEKITTLDGISREIPDGAIIIEDGKARIIDLCGIMGGKNSEVNEKTKRVLLFVQTYDPIRIRRTCQELAFRTEAASRFEKGVDPEGVLLAMKKATVMFKDLAGARVASKLIDIYPNPPKEKKVTLTQEKLNQIMGVEVGLSEAKKILESLGFIIKLDPKPYTLNANIPHWRHSDISIPEDLIEEVARIYGYHNLPSVLPAGDIPQEAKESVFYWEERTKDLLKDWGLTEVVSYSMISQEALESIGYQPKNYLKLTNPLTQELVYMRPSLIPSILQIIAQNQAHVEKIKIFELANIYLPRGKEKLPDERMTLAVGLTGAVFTQAKGIAEGLLAELGMENITFEPYVSGPGVKATIWHPGRTAMVKMKGKRLGIIGEIQPGILRRFGIKGRVVIFDLDFEEIAKLATTIKKYTPIPKYPAIVEDLAFVVPKKTLVGEMTEEIKKVNQLIKLVELIDSYKNTRTFRITYQSPKKTLMDKEVEKIRSKIVKRVKKEFSATLKSA